MQHLIDNGYTWHHEYAQCLVKHYVSEYVRGRINVPYPSKCAKQESERKLENFERKLGQKKQTLDDVNAGRGNRLPMENDPDDRLEKKEEEEFKEYLRQFSDDELENIKNFLILESAASAGCFKLKSPSFRKLISQEKLWLVCDLWQAMVNWTTFHSSLTSDT